MSLWGWKFLMEMHCDAVMGEVREDQNTEAYQLEIAVAIEAPATPKSSPTIKMGSSTQF